MAAWQFPSPEPFTWCIPDVTSSAHWKRNTMAGDKQVCLGDFPKLAWKPHLAEEPSHSSPCTHGPSHTHSLGQRANSDSPLLPPSPTYILNICLFVSQPGKDSRDFQQGSLWKLMKTKGAGNGRFLPIASVQQSTAAPRQFPAHR